MKEESFQFYDDNMNLGISPADIDNGTVEITIPTPKDWKCERKGCPTDFKHTHGTYSFPDHKDDSEL